MTRRLDRMLRTPMLTVLSPAESHRLGAVVDAIKADNPGVRRGSTEFDNLIRDKVARVQAELYHPETPTTAEIITAGADAHKQIEEAVMAKPKFYECDICGHCHPWAWDGDCRDDANRFRNDELDDKYGLEGIGYELLDMEDRLAADEGCVR